MDHAFALLIDFLKENNLYDHSFIIFTSDHGEEFGEHGMLGRHDHTLFDELLKVPLIIKFPNSQYKGRVFDEQVRGIDILPTLLDWLNINCPDYFEGVSLIPLIKGESPEEELYAISQRDVVDFRINSIRTNNWKWYESKKYLYFSDNKLFDLEHDPSEKNNVSKYDKKTTEILKHKLKETLSANKAIFIKSQKIKFNKQLKEQLRALGYLE